MRRNSIKEFLLFAATVLALSWFVFWGPIALFRVPTVNLVNGMKGQVWAIVIFILGGFVPTATGICLTGYFEGRAAVAHLLKSSLSVQIGSKWILLILLVALYFALALTGIYRAVGGRFDYGQFLAQLPTVLPLLVLGPLSEELGWRGFALKRLLNHMSANRASLAVGVVWAIWHLPLFYMAGSSQYEFHMPFLPFLVNVASLSFIYTYLYKRIGGRLFSAVLMHWAYTYVLQVVSSSVERTPLYNWLECVPALMIGAAFALLLSRDEKVKVEAGAPRVGQTPELPG